MFKSSEAGGNKDEDIGRWSKGMPEQTGVIDKITHQIEDERVLGLSCRLRNWLPKWEFTLTHINS